MAKSSVAAYGAEGEQKVLMMDPLKLTLVTDKAHPLYDERVHLPIDEAMVVSIMAHGVLQPIRIRKNPENGDIEVVYGRQRVKNTIEANRRLKKAGAALVNVPSSVSRDDAAALFGVSVVENEIRRPDTPQGRAEKARKLLGLGRSEEQVAADLGVGTSTLKNMLRFLEATAAVRKAADGEKITMDTAYRLSKLEPDEQRERLEKILKDAPREVKAGGKKGKSGSGKKAKAIADGRTVMRSAKEIAAMRAQINGYESSDDDERERASMLLGWVLGEEADLSSLSGEGEVRTKKAS